MAVLALGVISASCEKDNYAEPKTQLTGQIVYKGEPVGVEYGQVRLQLWQPGFGKLAPIDAPIDQDGSYSALLFDGNYKLVFTNNDGPWKTLVKDATAKDTTFVSLNGNQEVDIEVMPYYMIRNAKFSKEVNKVSSTFDIEKIITGADAKDVERVSLLISRTQFVSRANNVAITNKEGDDVTGKTNFSLSVDVPTISPAQDFVFARVGVKVKDVEDMVFSKVEKIQL
ncbi:DUF3823 domain-containing protein [Cytophagaceae bacterium SJW1-29]|uniref:DUF3823 domain-containing protein n=1 Tax=Salmonirosea aquatica TaxID=2654236 RepID=A0A7C9BJU9_9BACT|nr:DUF3823 domain-containing protein [Cytophagaceae bacterium SJW1-29]